MDPRYVVKWKYEKKPNRDRPDVTIERSKITLGSRPLSDVYVPDRLVPKEALEFTFDGRRLEVDVKGPLSGVFVNGAPVTGRGPVPNGGAVQVGPCLIEVAIDAPGSLCTLTVGEKYLTATVGALAKKAPQPFALEDAGPQEHRWGKSPVLRTANWIAVLAGLLLVAAYPFVRDTDFVNRGDLFHAHAIGSEKGPKDCAACHAPFSSSYGPQCAKCHEAYDSEKHHPYAKAADFSCSECHFEHRGATADIMPSLERTSSGWPRTCESCHSGQDVTKRVADAVVAPDLASRARDRTEAAVARPLQVDGFAHRDHRVAKPVRASLAGGAARPQGDVPIPCSKCHEARASKDVPGATADADFGLVKYAKCLECHAEWRVDVHGREQGGVHCFQCHVKADDPAKITKDIRTTDVVRSGSLYELVPRKHDFTKDDCRACHVDAKTAAAAVKPTVQAFRHDHHLRTVKPEKGGALALAATCVECHKGVAESASLAGLGTSLPAATLDGCTDCHTEGAPKPVAPKDAAAPRRIVDMFHSVHTVEPGTSGAAVRRLAGSDTLAGGCLSCHVPAVGTEPMKLKDGAADCTACHKGHESLGSGKCALCHLDRAAPENIDPRTKAVVYRRNEAGIFDPAKSTTKSAQPVKGFRHFVGGHAKDAQDATGAGCAKCHDAAAVDQALRVRDVAWPGPTDRGCVECHVGARYHR